MLVCGTSARVLDNFNDNNKTGWTDFSFVPGFGLPVESNGQFRFEQPAAGRQIFSASQKTTETFELKEGRTIEMRVDIAQTGGKDSFAVLGFLPTTNSPGTLSGYGLSKSTTDVLLTKGIGDYFLAESWPPSAMPDAPSENITLVLKLTAKDGNVTINGRILDKANNNAVLWERTFVDTPNADALITGPNTDQPKEPFITSGYFTLYLFQDFSSSAPEDPYFVVYDNAQVWVSETTILDNFDDNTKTAWTDFSFVPGFGIPTETGGQFRFEQPAAGRQIFSASQKTTRAFDLAEGDRLEFRVDVAQTGGKDSFAVLAFLPTTNSPGTLSGYGLSKSSTDVLLTKGIGEYFIAEGWPPANNVGAPSENITLVLSLAAENGNVTITGRILDKSNSDVILWERSVVDTPVADALITGPNTDQPAEPFITSGYFTLYLFQDFSSSAPEDPYFVVYDNATAVAPPLPQNTAPLITEAQPLEFGNFLPVNTTISFKGTDDKNLPDNAFSILLNGTSYTTTNGLVLSAAGSARTASLSGKLEGNVTYTAVFLVTDSDGLTTAQNLYFDTFSLSNPVIETENYNFGSGIFLDNPVLSPESPGSTDPIDGSYRNQVGTEGIDFHDIRTSPRSQDAPYRATDPVRMSQSLDYVRDIFEAAGGAAAQIYDYDLKDIAQGEWLNYTHTFAPGSYEVYLRQSIVNVTTAQASLELVTSDPTQADQATKPLGSFLGVKSGYKYRNVPLTDGTGASKIIVRLNGKTTFRLKQNTSDPDEDTGIRQNYLMFVPVPDPGIQRAAIASISPAPNSQTETFSPTIAVAIQDRDTTVKAGSIKLEVNGKTVSPNITNDANGTIVTYPITPLPVSGIANTAKITFQDSLDFSISSEWTFVINYKSLNAADRVSGTGKDTGFKVRVVQAPAGSGLANSIQRAEDQLAPNSPIEKVVDLTATATVINYDKKVGESAADFADDLPVPGIDFDANGDEDFAVEILAYLDLSAGVHRFGVITDDGYKVSAGATLGDTGGLILGFHSGGPANETFDFLAPAAGLYPFRMVWYERGGSGYAEWSSVDPQTGAKTLINDTNSPSAIKAYTTFTPIVTDSFVRVESSGTVQGGYIEDLTAQETARGKFTIPLPSGNRFYRLRGPGGILTITNSQISGNTLTLSYTLEMPGDAKTVYDSIEGLQ